MPDLHKGRSSTAAGPGRNSRPRSGRAGIIWLIVISLLFILGGIEVLALGVVRIQDAAQLSAAPVCTSSQQTGCRLDEQVVVVDRYKESQSARGPLEQIVKVRTPDDNTYTVPASDHDSGLWSQLQIGEKVKAELWEGSVIRLDDDAGHYILADDSPVVTSVLFPIIGVLAVIGGGALLVFSVRALRRQRNT